MKTMFGLCLALALGLFGATAAQAQMAEFNLHAGALRYDLGLDGDNDSENTDTDVLVGTRLMWHTASGFGIGGNFDFVFADKIDLPESAEDDDINVNIYLYSAELAYSFPTMGRAQFFVNAGVGGATTQIDDLPGADDDFTRESSTELLVPLGGGLRFLNREVDPSWAIRVDARDNIIFVDQFDTVEEDTDKEPTNNFELSAGLSFFFGGGGSSDFDGDGVDDDRDACPDTRAGVAVDDTGCPYDSDGDGVADDRDLCPNTPAGARVDGSGCPLDSDSDGVTDDRDQCPNTPAGTMVDSEGCPVVEDEPDVAACVDGRSWFRGDDTISFEGRNWVKFGAPQSVSMDELFELTDYDGVPVYVRSDARRPYREALLPFCSPGNTYQLYQPERAVRGTTG